jgi:hypothetical protein
VPDECDDDCDSNGIPDDCETVIYDCDGDGTPDECEAIGDQDCDGDGECNGYEIANCTGDPACDDCNSNGVPDGCELVLNDCDGDGIPNECDDPCFPKKPPPEEY